MDRVELIINAGKISSRIKVSLQDVLELRNVLLYMSVCLSVCMCCVGMLVYMLHGLADRLITSK